MKLAADVFFILLGLVAIWAMIDWAIELFKGKEISEPKMLGVVCVCVALNILVSVATDVLQLFL